MIAFDVEIFEEEAEIGSIHDWISIEVRPDTFCARVSLVEMVEHNREIDGIDDIVAKGCGCRACSIDITGQEPNQTQGSGIICLSEIERGGTGYARECQGELFGQVLVGFDENFGGLATDNGEGKWRGIGPGFVGRKEARRGLSRRGIIRRPDGQGEIRAPIGSGSPDPTLGNHPLKRESSDGRNSKTDTNTGGGCVCLVSRKTDSNTEEQRKRKNNARER